MVICTGRRDLHVLIYLIDLPTLILLLFLSLPNLFISGLWRDFIRAFHLGNSTYKYTLSELKRSLEAVTLLQKQLAYSGILISFMSMIYVLTQLDDLSTLGPCLAIVCLSAFYTAIFEIILMPLYVQIKKCIIDYMEADES